MGVRESHTFFLFRVFAISHNTLLSRDFHTQCTVGYKVGGGDIAETHCGVAPLGVSRMGPSWGLPLFLLVDDPPNTDVHNKSTVFYLEVSSVLQGQGSGTVKFIEFTS